MLKVGEAGEVFLLVPSEIIHSLIVVISSDLIISGKSFKLL